MELHEIREQKFQDNTDFFLTIRKASFPKAPRWWHQESWPHTPGAPSHNLGEGGHPFPWPTVGGTQRPQLDSSGVLSNTFPKQQELPRQLGGFSAASCITTSQHPCQQALLIPKQNHSSRHIRLCKGRCRTCIHHFKSSAPVVAKLGQKAVARWCLRMWTC